MSIPFFQALCLGLGMMMVTCAGLKSHWKICRSPFWQMSDPCLLLKVKAEPTSVIL